MREPDEKIDKLIAALRDAKPSAGMQIRILAAVEAHPSPSAVSFWRRFFGCRLRDAWLLHPVLATSIACVALLAVSSTVTIIRLRPLHKPAETIRDSPQRQTAAQAKPFAPAGPVVWPPRPAQVSARHPHRDAPAAGKERRRASFPAPPLPLTEQERLLVLVAHQRDPKSLAILNGDLRAAESAKVSQEFQQFFGMSDKEMRSQLE